MLFRPIFDFAPDGAPSSGTQGAQGGEGESQQQGDGEQTVDYETWYAGLGASEKAALDNHTHGLKSALDSERTSRKTLEKQLRDMAKTAQEGSDAQKQLTEMADKMSEADRRATFYDDAHAAGVTNLKLAYLVAVQDELFNRNGTVDFKALRANYPELFGAVKKVAPGRAGSGTDSDQPAVGMNAFIRKASGR